MAQQLILDILPPPAPTLANMVVGENAAVITAVKTLPLGQTLYIWGSPGSGRSHLLKAATHYHQGIYLTSDQFGSIQDRLDQDGAMPPCVAIDDTQNLAPEGLALLFRLYNRWREDASDTRAFRLIVAGHSAPLQMHWREDLRTRLGWGMVYRLMALSDSEKFAALMSHAHDRGMPLSEDVVRWLLVHGSRDTRTLFGWLDALDKYALAQHRPLTLPLLKSLLAQRETHLSESDRPELAPPFEKD